MNSNTVKLLMAVFTAVIIISLIFIAVSRYEGPGPAQPLPGSPASGTKVFAESSAAQAGLMEESQPIYRTGLSTQSIQPDRTEMLVKRGDFNGVAEDPKGLMEVLGGMAGGNRGEIPVRLTDHDLTKKISVSGPEQKKTAAGPYSMPELGESTYTQMGVLNMIKAPVDFKIFKTSETWWAFASSHKGRFPAANFSKEHIVILVSVSELPSGIFKIAEVKRTEKNMLVRYRVDPLAMSADSESKEYFFYSAAILPKTTLPVKLEQVP